MATSTLGSGTLVLAGTTSGTTTVTATAVAGTTTLTLPAATDTLVGRATTDTLTNKTLTGAAMNGTVGATTPSTGAFIKITTTSTANDWTNIVIGNTTSGQSYGTRIQAGTTAADYSFLVKNATNATEYFSILGNGAAAFGNGLAITGLTDISAATSGQIKFPATQNASSNANTLDDYEEGSWTYDFTATTGTITKSATYLYGYYTKVGRVVTITGFLQVASVSSPTGVLTLTGLPFPITSTGSREGFVGGGIYGSSLAVGSVSPLMVSGSAGDSSLTISKFVTGSAASLAGDVVADTRFQISFSYFS